MVEVSRAAQVKEVAANQARPKADGRNNQIKTLRAPSFQGESEDKDDRRDDPRFVLDNQLEEFREEGTAFGHAVEEFREEGTAFGHAEVIPISGMSSDVKKCRV
jgi:hypothetical protein